MTEIKVFWCGRCKTFPRSTRQATRKHLREIHGVKGATLKKDESGSAVSVLTMSGVFQ